MFRGPRGKLGTFLYDMYNEPRIAVASIRTKMMCKAWNWLGESLEVNSFAAVLIYGSESAISRLAAAVPMEKEYV